MVSTKSRKGSRKRHRAAAKCCSRRKRDSSVGRSHSVDRYTNDVRPEGSVHARQGTPDIALVARGRSRDGAAPARPQPGKRVRRETVEHPFGTIKAWVGAAHFHMRSLPKGA